MFIKRGDNQPIVNIIKESELTEEQKKELKDLAKKSKEDKEPRK